MEYFASIYWMICLMSGIFVLILKGKRSSDTLGLVAFVTFGAISSLFFIACWLKLFPSPFPWIYANSRDLLKELWDASVSSVYYSIFIPFGYAIFWFWVVVWVVMVVFVVTAAVCISVSILVYLALPLLFGVDLVKLIKKRKIPEGC